LVVEVEGAAEDTRSGEVKESVDLTAEVSVTCLHHVLVEHLVAIPSCDVRRHSAIIADIVHIAGWRKFLPEVIEGEVAAVGEPFVFGTVVVVVLVHMEGFRQLRTQQRHNCHSKKPRIHLLNVFV